MRLPTKIFVSLLVTSLLLTALVICQSEDDGDSFVNDEDDVVEEAVEPKPTKPTYVKPTAKGNVFFTETFDSDTDFQKKWLKSEAKKDDIDEAIAKYDGQWAMEEPADNPIEGDLGLVLKSRAKHHAISAKLETPYQFIGKSFVMQYEVRFQNGQECGGAYVKLLTHDDLNLKKFTDKTGYTIMFGPDKCGNDNKLHFIFRHKHPINGKFEEKHAKKPTAALDSYFTDKMTHLYTLVINPDNTFEVYIDQNLMTSGNLLEDMSPPVNPQQEIVDPEDKKPEDWDEREKIPDPDATKPDDWDEDEPEMIVDPNAVKPDGWLNDEPELVPDPDAEMPSDWDEDMDGEWEPPMIQNVACESAPGCGEWESPQIKNPKFKGMWKAPMIDNPSYKGKWKPRRIPNPDYFEDKEPYKMTSIGAVGLELWSMSDDILFDNFIITDDKAVADDWAEDTWAIKRKQEKSGTSVGRSVVDAILDATTERPWLWAVFVVVIILPVVLVIAYCCMPSTTKGGFSYLWDAGMERKWLFGVYAMIGLLPIVLLSFWLCPSTGPVESQSTTLHPKKTDRPTPDDKIAEDDESEKSEGSETAKDDADETVKMSAGDATSSKTPKAKKSDLEAEEEENEADNEDENAKPATKSSPRKRKTKARKD